ncbi:hypothetical protein PHLGIDRAFT_49512, partial [Phlebiopsis gigantea 11061_1 CR5-6]
SYMVIGGAGFLGRHIVSSLLNRGISRVAVVDLLPLKLEGVETFVCDVTDKGALDFVFEKFQPTCVIHAVAAPLSATADTQWAVNYTGTRNAVSAAIEYGVKAFVLSSDASVVFEGKGLEGIDERYGFPRYALHAYLDSKAWAESFVQDKNREGDLRTACIRCSAIFGPGSSSVVHPIADAFRSQSALTFEVGDNVSLFDWTYVTNAAEAHVLAVEQLLLKQPVDGEAFFITNGEPRPFWDVPNAIHAMHAIVGGRCIITGVPSWLARFVAGAAPLFMDGTTASSRLLMQCFATYCTKPQWFDISKARLMLGYRPAISLNEGIRLTVE